MSTELSLRDFSTGQYNVYLNKLTCTGYGSCFLHKDGVAAATINKISTLQPDTETSTVANSTILLDAGTGDQDLVMYFDEIKNLNIYGGDAVKITEGKASLIGRNINCTKGKSLDLIENIVSAFIQCDEIISLSEGINIANSDEAIVIEANYIEGSSGNDGVVRSSSGSKYILRNAKIKCVDISISSVCLFISTGIQEIEIENLILVTGNLVDGDTIRRDGSNIEVKNLGLFVNKAINESLITLVIGTGLIEPDDYNYKYIVDPIIS